MTITGDVLLFFFGILALILMTMSNRNILFALASSGIWFALFMWMFFSSSPPLDITQDWVRIMTWSFLILVFIPWVVRMDVEIRNEAKGKGGDQAYKTWGAPPEGEKTTRAQEYRTELRRRRR